jgi:hypothetical protein
VNIWINLQKLAAVSSYHKSHFMTFNDFSKVIKSHKKSFHEIDTCCNFRYFSLKWSQYMNETTENYSMYQSHEMTFNDFSKVIKVILWLFKSHKMTFYDFLWLFWTLPRKATRCSTLVALHGLQRGAMKP